MNTGTYTVCRETPRETLRPEPWARAILHPFMVPATADHDEIERIAMKRAFGLRVTKEEFRSLGFRDCETAYGEPRCTCGHYSIAWPDAPKAPEQSEAS